MRVHEDLFPVEVTLGEILSYFYFFLQIMGSIFKPQKEDRISNLPDSVLTHILSFLPTKFAFATSALSRGWKDQWRSLTDLNFDDTLLKEPSFDLNPDQMLTFMGFVDNVMMNRDNTLSIHKFSLSCCGDDYDSHRVNKWVNLAIRQNVKEMILDLCVWGRFHLPKAIFACETLVVLKLRHDILVDSVPSVVSLPRLKILHFSKVKFAQYEPVETIVNGCPLLEELMFRNCTWEDDCVLRIIGLPFLKKLTINLLGNTPVSDDDDENEVVIDAPSLEYLNLKVYSDENLTILNLGSLVDAKIDVFEITDWFDTSLCNRIFALAHAISNIRSLSLSGNIMVAIEENAHNTNFLPTFTNLTRLDLYVDRRLSWSGLPEILASSPILETLSFPEGFIHKDTLVQHRIWLDPLKNVPNCLLLHLKEIEIKNFRGLEDELILIKYILENSLVLEKISIECLSEVDKITEKFQNFHKGSRKCRIILSSSDRYCS